MIDETGNSNEFLEQFINELNKDKSKDNSLSKKQKKNKDKVISIRVQISQDDKLKLNILDLSPSILCEDFIRDFLDNVEIKKKLNSILKRLK